MFNDLLQRIQPDTLILTANKRLTNWVAHLQHNFQLSRNVSTWFSLDVLPFNSWLIRYFTELQIKSIGSALTLLNPQQELLLWQKIIQTQTDDALLSIYATATTAQQAWKLLKEHNIALDDPGLQQTNDGSCFTKWAKTFAQQCKTNHWVDHASLFEIINSQLKNITLPKHIILVGFLEFKPAEQTLLDTLKELGCKIEHYQTRMSNQSIRRISLADTEHEIYAMANWAKQQLENAINIGCIVPNQNEIYTDIKRIFGEVFAENKNAYNISYGDKLSNEPIIYAALEILRLKTGKISIDDIGYLLRSPFIGSPQDLPQRAMLDFNLRKINQTEFSLNQLIQTINHIDTNSNFVKQLEALQTIKFKKHQSPHEWVDVFTKQLQAVGWPGATMQPWQKLLQEFSSLDLVAESFTSSQALTNLKRIAAQTPFQIKTKYNAPIQVLGVLEATGLPFDYTWVIGLDDKSWPAIAKPNALLPIALQRKLNMPHASAEREYHFSQTMRDQFIKHTSNIIFSYPKQNNDETLQPSPLIKNFTATNTKQLNIALPRTFISITKQQFENISDDQAPAVQENESLRASTDILEQQAACPFRAFAKHRLLTYEIPQPAEGINPLDRGSITHKALEIIWQKIKTHKNLCSMNENELHQLIDASIQKSLKLKSEFAKLEQQRLHKLIYDWLQIEKNRMPFTVTEQEQKYTIKCGKLKLNVRIDRIDQLENNDYILIDYKTGKAKISVNDWFGDRPNKPQLPLYAVSLPKQLSTIAFAQLIPTNLKFNYVGTNKDYLPKNKSSKEIDWEQQLQEWKKIIVNLANDFYAGKADVDPKNPNDTCKFCKLHALCRIYAND
jgi:probable DNA repair protein